MSDLTYNGRPVVFDTPCDKRVYLFNADLLRNMRSVKRWRGRKFVVRPFAAQLSAAKRRWSGSPDRIIAKPDFVEALHGHARNSASEPANG